MSGRELVYNQRKATENADKTVQKGPVKRIFNRFKGRLATGALSLTLLGSAAAVSGCSEEKKQSTEQTTPEQKSESGKGFKTLETKDSVVSSMPVKAKKKEGNVKGIVPQPVKEISPMEELEQKMNKALLQNDAKAMKGIIKETSSFHYVRFENGENALGLACYQGDFEMAKVLIDAKMKVNDASKESHTGITGTTPLMNAASASFKEKAKIKIAKLLIKKGADLTQEDKNGWTALMHAAASGSADMIKLLLDNGAKVSQRDLKGKTPLHYAVEKGNIDVVKVLLKNGADPTRMYQGATQFKKGKSALQIAKENNDTEMTKLLEKYVMKTKPKKKTK